MDFFGIGPGEVLVILIVALIIFGPERLADIGKTLGKTVHAFRRAASDLTTQVTKEIEEAKTAVTPEPDHRPPTRSPGESATASPQPEAQGTSKLQDSQDGTVKP